MVRAPRRIVAVALTALVGLSVAACSSDDSDEGASPAGTETVVRVPADAPTISAGVDLVRPGGLVLVSPGVYPEQVHVDKEDVTVRGTDRNAVVIDGEGRRPYGVLGTADGVRVENLTATGSTLYGVLVTSSFEGDEPLAHGAGGYEPIDPERFPPLQRFRVDHVTATNNGLYGVYAFNAQHGVITDSFASGSADSGIYVGQCRDCDILVTGNVATRNAVGFENANASDSLTITGNRFSGNRVGMTLTSDYQEAFTPQRGNAVFGNVISDNVEATSPRHAEGAFGIGVGIGGGRENLLSHNLITGNARAGVLFNNAEDLPALDNRLADNAYAGNGVDVANVSSGRSPAERNCFEAGASEAPVGLAAACPGAQPIVVGDLAGPQEPPGVSFLDVPGPDDLPSLPADDTVPDPLPAVVDRPSPETATLPTADLLIAWLAVRP